MTANATAELDRRWAEAVEKVREMGSLGVVGLMVRTAEPEDVNWSSGEDRDLMYVLAYLALAHILHTIEGEGKK